MLFPRCLLFLLVGAVLSAQAQSTYNLVGTARSVPNSACYQLTNSQQFQNGAVWYTQLLRLSESFELEFTVNLGTNPAGADGVVMVLQTAGNTALGKAGEGIGFQGFSPSLGIEFDTYQNQNLGDPAFDHVALVRDGVSDHNAPSNGSFAAPVPLAALSTNAKDGRDHRASLHWNATSRQLEVFVDCQKRISQSIDLVNDVFRGTTEVYFGFTGATGGSVNTHTVCLQNNIIARDTFRVCQGERLTLVARESIDDTYQWKPAAGLDNATLRTPSLTATRDQLYTVAYRDRCSVARLDSVVVKPQTPPRLSLGGNRDVCADQPLTLVPTLTPVAAKASYRWNTGDTIQRISPSQSGSYALKVKTGVCQVADSVQVTIHPLPRLDSLPAYECLRDQPVLLDARASGPGLRYGWTPGNTTGSTLSVSAAGTYGVNIRTDFGCAASRSFRIRDDCPALVFMPNVFTPNNDGQNDQLDWKATERLDSRLTIYNRWGEVLFFAENGQESWNGTYNGLPCPPAEYLYRLDYRPRRLADSAWFSKRGRVLLLR